MNKTMPVPATKRAQPKLGPGRANVRRAARELNKKGDLTRKSTHRMKSNMGLKAKP